MNIWVRRVFPEADFPSDGDSLRGKSCPYCRDRTFKLMPKSDSRERRAVKSREISEVGGQEEVLSYVVLSFNKHLNNFYVKISFYILNWIDEILT